MSALALSPLHPNPALYMSPEMVAELALGMDPPYDIAARYGLSKKEFDALQAQPWFGELVARKRVEFHAEGQLFETKARMMLEELSQQAFKSAITGTMPMNLVLDLMRQLGDYSGVKAKQGGVQGGGGPAFQINIQVNGDTAKARTTRFDAPAEVEPVTMSIPMGDVLPPKPEGLRVPDFDLRVGRDLIGNAAA